MYVGSLISRNHGLHTEGLAWFGQGAAMLVVAVQVDVVTASTTGEGWLLTLFLCLGSD